VHVFGRSINGFINPTSESVTVMQYVVNLFVGYNCIVDVKEDMCKTMKTLGH